MHACLLLLPGNVLAGRGKEKKIHRKTLKEAQNSFIMVVKVRNLIITRSVCTSYLSATLICIKFWWNHVSIPPSQVRAICAKSQQNRSINKKNSFFGGRGGAVGDEGGMNLKIQLCQSFPTYVRTICSKSQQNRSINKKFRFLGGRGGGRRGGWGGNLRKMRLMSLYIHMKNHSMKFGPNPPTLTFFGSSESAKCQIAFLRF